VEVTARKGRMFPVDGRGERDKERKKERRKGRKGLKERAWQREQAMKAERGSCPRRTGE